MKRPIFIVLSSLVGGMLYGKLATIFHWYLPPNWLADITRTGSVETRVDMAYISLYIDALLIGFALSILLCLIERGTMRRTDP
jgi:hypothetical protein